MNHIALVLVCLACGGSGRRVQIHDDRQRLLQLGQTNDENWQLPKVGDTTSASNPLAKLKQRTWNGRPGAPGGIPRNLLQFNNPFAAWNAEEVASDDYGDVPDSYSEADASTEFLEYCGRCGYTQYACVEGPAQGRCSATPWAANEVCERGVDCSTVLGADRATAPPWLGFLRVASKNCRNCLKDCLGAKIQAAQLAAMKIQAPLTVVYMLLYGNRPIRMWPIEGLLDKLGFNPVVFGGAAAGAYMSCLKTCDKDCPYAGLPSPSAWELGLASELEDVDPTDLTFLDKFYNRDSKPQPSSPLGQAISELKQAIKDIFAIPGFEDPQ